MTDIRVITWLHPEENGDDNYAWEIWYTTCKQYQIVCIATPQEIYYISRALVSEVNTGKTITREYVRISPNQPTLDAAMERVNEYHCQQYNLVLTGAY